VTGTAFADAIHASRHAPGGADPITPALSNATGALGSDITTAATATTAVLTTGSLAVGTWLVVFSITSYPTASGNYDITTTVASGSATLAGNKAASAGEGTASRAALSTLVVVATVTATATLTCNLVTNGTSAVAKASTVAGSVANATAWTAVRIG
jgi:hypothetical protein